MTSSSSMSSALQTSIQCPVIVTVLLALWLPSAPVYPQHQYVRTYEQD
jgi:hypothetical protein